jgi:two-component system, LuxR family, response regulator FixJ
VDREKTDIIRLGIVDDDPAVSDALAPLFDTAGFEVHAFVSSDDFLRVAKHTKLDCVLLGGSLSARSEHAVLAALGAAGDPVPVLIVSGRRDIPFAVAVIKAGAYDFIEKPFEGEVVVERVREAVRNWAPAESMKSWLRIPQAAGLTPREIEVLEQIAGGASNKVTGQNLTMSPRTVEVHRARLMDKLGARNTADLMRIVLS